VITAVAPPAESHFIFSASSCEPVYSTRRFRSRAPIRRSTVSSAKSTQQVPVRGRKVRLWSAADRRGHDSAKNKDLLAKLIGNSSAAMSPHHIANFTSFQGPVHHTQDIRVQVPRPDSEFADQLVEAGRDQIIRQETTRSGLQSDYIYLVEEKPEKSVSPSWSVKKKQGLIKNSDLQLLLYPKKKQKPKSRSSSVSS